MVLITMSNKASSAGTPTVVITATNMYGSQAPCMMTVISCFMGVSIDLTGGIFATVIGLYAFILSFVKMTTVR